MAGIAALAVVFGLPVETAGMVAQVVAGVAGTLAIVLPESAK